MKAPEINILDRVVTEMFYSKYLNSLFNEHIYCRLTVTNDLQNIFLLGSFFSVVSNYSASLSSSLSSKLVVSVAVKTVHRDAF